MEVKWLAGKDLDEYGGSHLLLENKDKLVGPFCRNIWWYGGWEEDPNPVKCHWCLKAERWIRLVEGEPLETLKRIPGYSPTVRKHTLGDL